jgi:hypothetical protein
MVVMHNAPLPLQHRMSGLSVIMALTCTTGLAWPGPGRGSDWSRAEVACEPEVGAWPRILSLGCTLFLGRRSTPPLLLSLLAVCCCLCCCLCCSRVHLGSSLISTTNQRTNGCHNCHHHHL